MSLFEEHINAMEIAAEAAAWVCFIAIFALVLTGHVSMPLAIAIVVIGMSRVTLHQIQETRTRWDRKSAEESEPHREQRREHREREPLLQVQRPERWPHAAAPIIHAGKARDAAGTAFPSPQRRERLAHILTQAAEGRGMSVIPSHAEPTTRQAANMLNVSRPYLIGLLKSGTIPYRIRALMRPEDGPLRPAG